MSFKSKLFQKSHLKLLLALAIPAALTWFFIYAQHEANQEVKEYKQEQAVNPTSEQISLTNYQLKEVDDQNHIRWQLVAKEGIAGKGNRQVSLEDVIVEYFDGDKLKVRLIAPLGQANEETRQVRLSSADRSPVCAEGEDGKARLSAKTVELTKKNQFLASGGVTIDYPGVAKVTGNSAVGTVGANGLNNIKIIGGTHAEIIVK